MTAMRRNDCAARFQLTFLFLLFVGGLFSLTAARAEDQKAPLERLLAEFSNPARQAESNRILDEILHRLETMAGAGRFSTSGHYIRQLEPARLGRTFSLFRSVEKQDQDAQVFRIRKFIAEFYRSQAEFERKRGLSEEANSFKPIINRYQAAIERTRKWLGTRPEKDLPCFEDDQASTPFPQEAGSRQLVAIPTTFFLSLPSPGCLGLPFVTPFSFLQTDGPTADVALDPGWTW